MLCPKMAKTPTLQCEKQFRVFVTKIKTSVLAIFGDAP